MVDEADGWLAIGDLSGSRRFRDGLLVGLPGLFVAINGFQFGLILGNIMELRGAVPLGLAVLFGALPLIVAALAWVVLNPVPFVDFARGRLRIRGRTMAIEDIDVARIVILQTGSFRKGERGEPVRAIRIGSQHGPQVSIVLWRGSAGSVEEQYRERLAEIIRRSKIDFPTSPYDPTGRFSKYNFPENFDKDGALAFVAGDQGLPEAPPDRDPQ